MQFQGRVFSEMRGAPKTVRITHKHTLAHLTVLRCKSRFAKAFALFDFRVVLRVTMARRAIDAEAATAAAQRWSLQNSLRSRWLISRRRCFCAGRPESVNCGLARKREPSLKLISWPGHSCFIKTSIQPPPIDSHALRRGDIPLMQRLMMKERCDPRTIL